MQDLNKFIKEKLKSKNMRVDKFISLCDMSKSMLYRILNGEQKPSDNLIDTMATVLNLNDIDKLNLIYCCSMIDTDVNISSARNQVNDFLFSKSYTDYEKIEFVYYVDNNKYVKNFNEILDDLVSCSKFDDFSCNMRMINCFDKGILNYVFDTFKLLLGNNKSYEIEHLIKFSKNNFKDNISILSDITRLALLVNYYSLYSESEDIYNDNIFDNVIILDYKYRVDGIIIDKHIIMSFLNENLSTCYVIDNMNLYDFFDRNYNSFKQYHKIAFTNIETLNMLQNTLIQLESQYNICLFKNDFCYNRVPVEVIINMITTVPEDERLQFFKTYLSGNIEKDQLEVYEKYLCELLQNRIDSSHKYKQIDVLTKHGLEKFAKTGMLSDTKDTFPPFDKNQKKIILEYIKRRNNDKDDLYKLYIVDKKYINENMHIICYQDYGLVIEYSNPLLNNNVMYYIVIEHKKLADVFFDFTENYVPTLISLQENKMNDFIDELILKYCSDN